jgi:hypothetical protein
MISGVTFKGNEPGVGGMSDPGTEKIDSDNNPKAAFDKRAFISAPASTDAQVLKNLLKQEGIIAFTADELDVGGLPFSQIIRRAIGDSQLVVAVLGAGPVNENVLFELGIAQGMNKPTLLVVEGDASLPIPVQSSGIPYLRTSATNADAIRYGLRLFIAAPHHGSRAANASSSQTHPIGSSVDELLHRVRALKHPHAEMELVAILADALKQSGVSAIFEQPKNLRSDLAVWSEDLEPWVSNPLPIEVRSKILSRAEAERLFERLCKDVPAKGAIWALLIYHTAQEAVVSAVSRGPILAISAEQFLESLRNVSFGELIRNLRNARVHGR